MATLELMAADSSTTSAPTDEDLTQSTGITGFEPVGLILCVLTGLYAAWAVLNSTPLQSANDRSRWCTVWSLVERGTYQIDEIDRIRGWSTIDKVRHRKDEDSDYHFYSSKPPLFPTLMAGLYWLEKQSLGYELRLDHEDRDVQRAHLLATTRMLLLLVNVLPLFLAMLSLRRSLMMLVNRRLTLWVMLVVAGFTSMLMPYLTTLNNHTPAATCLVFSISAVIRLRIMPEPRLRDFASLGFWAAMTCCFELPAALFGLLSFFVAVSTDVQKTARAYVPAALVPLAAFFITNIICTGGIKPFYAYYGTEKYRYMHEGVPSYWMDPKGIDANDESPPVYLLHCVAGHHGILSLTPIFLLTFYGWFRGLRSATMKRWKVIHLLGIGISLTVLLFYLSRTQNYNYGGNSCALRWMLWLVPFWWMGMVPAVDRLSRSRGGLLLIAFLSCASIYSSFDSLQKPWKPNWIFTLMQEKKWIDYRTKRPPFDPPRYSVIASLPKEPVAVRFTGDLGAESLALEIECTEIKEVNGESVHFLTVVKVMPNRKNRARQEFSLYAPSDGPRRGIDIAKWLFNVDQEAPLVTTYPNLLRNLRGVARAKPYNNEGIRYFRYTRPDGTKTAIRCQRAACQTTRIFKDRKCSQRCDVYFSDEVPFGVAQWTVSLTDMETGEAVMETQRFTSSHLP